MARIGIEWVKEYHGIAPNLPKTQKQAERFYDNLSGTRVFNWGDDMAWDIDFEEHGVGSPSTGWDILIVDSVHIAYFSGHGSSGGISFGITDEDDGVARPTEIRWGNSCLEWIVLDACETLKEDGVFNRWEDSFNGLHIILGFHSTANDESKRGKYFANYLDDGHTVIESWKKACKLTAYDWNEWAFLRAGGGEDVDTSNDHWHGKGWVSPTPDNSRFSYGHGSC